MKLCVLLPFALASAAALVSIGCATGDAKPDPPGNLGDSAIDGAGGDAGGDAALADTDCLPGFSKTEACGTCGSRSRTCGPSGAWGDWTKCAGEVKGPTDCLPGQTQKKTCGNCGSRTDSCDTATCLWVNGTCGGEGVCAAGATDSKPCSTAGQAQTRTCSAACAWGDYAACATPAGWRATSASPLSARAHATVVWTGTDAIYFGGTDAKAKADGARYALATDTWSAIAAPPASLATGRTGHTAVWTGTAMIIFGGYDASFAFHGDGASYDPKADAWAPIAAAPIAARSAHRAVWATTTREMLVWGGDAGSPQSDGAAYDPATDKWRILHAAPISARNGHSMVWNGTQAIVFGGYGGGIDGYADGAAYDPSADAWTLLPAVPSGFASRYDHSAVAVGNDMLIWGGYGGTDFPTLAKNTGARLTISGTTMKWTAIANADDTTMTPTSHRYGAQAWSDGKKLWVWSGQSPSFPSPASGGAAYDVAADAWSAMTSKGAPPPRRDASVVWTGGVALVWGGSDQLGKLFADGAVFGG